MKRIPLPRSQKPIKRTPLPRATKPIPKKRKISRRVSVDRDQNYKNWLKTQRCSLCVKLHSPGRGLPQLFAFFNTIDPAHTDSNNGMSSKAADSSCAPLCRYHHVEYDAGRENFEAKYDIDMSVEAQRNYAQYLRETT